MKQPTIVIHDQLPLTDGRPALRFSNPAPSTVRRQRRIDLANLAESNRKAAEAKQRQEPPTATKPRRRPTGYQTTEARIIAGSADRRAAVASQVLGISKETYNEWCARAGIRGVR